MLRLGRFTAGWLAGFALVLVLPRTCMKDVAGE